MALATPPGRFEIRDWVVDPALDEVVLHGHATKVEPRMMRLLVCLARSNGEVVSPQRLLDEVWKDVVVSPASVYQSISRLRKILGDTEAPPTYIATVPRKGYRLVAPVRWVENTEPAPAQAAQPVQPVQAPHPARVRSSMRFRHLTVLALMVAILAGGILLLAYVRPHGQSLTSVATLSVAVLPFLDLTPDRSDGPFCDGLSRELSSGVAQIPNVHVIARLSTSFWQGRGQDPRNIGRQLAATHLLQGTVLRSGNRIRVSLEVIDTRRGDRIWSNVLERRFTDVPGIAAEVARSVATALGIRLPPAAEQHLEARKASNARAYELYLLARHYDGEATASSNAQAIKLYEQSVAMDGRFAAAHAGLAAAMIGQRHFGNQPLAALAAQAEPLLTRALQLSPWLSEAYAARGALRAAQSRAGEALSDLVRAVSLNPSAVAAFAELGRVYRRLGEPAGALASFAAAAGLDPLNSVLHAERCAELQELGRYDEAAEACTRARALEGDSAQAEEATAALALAQGNLDEALGWIDRALAISPERLELYETRAQWLLWLGLPAAARATYERARSASPADPDQLDADIANVVYVESGPAALREYLEQSNLESSSRADVLMAAVRLRMLLGEAALARQLLDRVLATADSNPNASSDVELIRSGASRNALSAWVLSHTGSEAEAQVQLRALGEILNRLERNGQVGYGLHLVRAQLLAQQGDPDGALRSLQHAADVGWRGADWARREPELAALWPRTDFQQLMERVSHMNDQLRAHVTATDPP